MYSSGQKLENEATAAAAFSRKDLQMSQSQYYCIVSGCENSQLGMKNYLFDDKNCDTNKSIPRNKVKGFCLFPRDHETCKKWIISLNRNKYDNKDWRVCEKHFKSSDFHQITKQSDRKKLRFKAVPSLYLPVSRRTDNKASKTASLIVKSLSSKYPDTDTYVEYVVNDKLLMYSENNYCSIPHCGLTEFDGVTLFDLPKSCGFKVKIVNSDGTFEMLKMQSAWLKLARIKVSKKVLKSQQIKICSEHFGLDNCEIAYFARGLTVKLLKDAIPSMNLTPPQDPVLSTTQDQPQDQQLLKADSEKQDSTTLTMLPVNIANEALEIFDDVEHPRLSIADIKAEKTDFVEIKSEVNLESDILTGDEEHTCPAKRARLDVPCGDQHQQYYENEIVYTTQDASISTSAERVLEIDPLFSCAEMDQIPMKNSETDQLLQLYSAEMDQIPPEVDQLCSEELEKVPMHTSTMEVTPENSPDLQNFCRVCATKTKKLTNIFSNKGLSIELNSKMEKCLQIRVDESEIALPQGVCQPCVIKLKQFDKLALTAQMSDLGFRSKVEEWRVQQLHLIEQQHLGQEWQSQHLLVTEHTHHSQQEGEVNMIVDIGDDDELIICSENLSNAPVENIPPSVSELLGEDNDDSNLFSSDFPSDVETAQETVLKPYVKQSKKRQRCIDDKTPESNVDKKEIVAKSTKSPRYCSNSKNPWKNPIRFLRNVPEFHFKNDFKCSLCDFKTNLVHPLSLHTLGKHRKEMCEICCQLFDNSDEVKNHTIEAHYKICNFCNDSFPNKRQFNEHIKKFHKAEPKYIKFKNAKFANHNCKICNKRFNSNNAVKHHYFWEHFMYACDICFQLFDHSDEQTKHTDEVHMMVCPYCNEKHYTKHRFKRHLNTHKNKSSVKKIQLSKGKEQIYECTFCNNGKGLSTKENVKRHNYWCHDMYTCTICLSTFSSMELEEKHFKSHGNVCQFCENGFGTENDLIEHEKSHSNCLPYLCYNCGDKFKSNNELNVHKETHDVKPMLLCDICGKYYKTRTVLVSHRYAHYKEKLECHICSKKFLFKSQLNSHMVIHTQEKNYNCEDCDLSFYNAKQLNDHMDIVHYDRNSISYLEKKVKCKFCMLRLPKCELQLHINECHIHPYVFQCRICEKRIVKENSLLLHINTHSMTNFKNVDSSISSYFEKVDVYVCDVCSRYFVSKSKLQAHVKRHFVNKNVCS